MSALSPPPEGGANLGGNTVPVNSPNNPPPPPPAAPPPPPPPTEPPALPPPPPVFGLLNCCDLITATRAKPVAIATPAATCALNKEEGSPGINCDVNAFCAANIAEKT